MISDSPHVTVAEIRSYDEDLYGRLRTAMFDSDLRKLIDTAPSRVLVKPNLIHASLPDAAQTTHPTLVESVVRILQEAGHEVILADSFSGARLWNERGLRTVYRKTGMEAVAKRTGCSLNWDTGWTIHTIPTGKVIKQVEMMNVVETVDWIVNVPKLKTHVYTGFTVSIKNMFGLVPGHFKVSYHARFADVQTFACALCDIALSLPVRFSVVDAVMAMEGNGPTGGTPRHVGAIFMGDDMFAVDSVAARFCGFEPRTIHWLPSVSVTVNGPAPESIIPRGLLRPDTRRKGMGVFSNHVIRTMSQRILRNVFAPVPSPDSSHCIRCGMCVNACPTSAVEPARKDAFPVIRKDLCIRCYCCHEACQHNAMVITPSRFARLFV